MTGYVYHMIEKKQTFSQFALTCARAFGALIEMREESMDAPIPAKFVPDEYHSIQLDKANKDLAQLQSMTEQEQETFGAETKTSLIAEYRRCIQKREEENKPLMAMLKEVEKWIPPTPEHEGLKSFMHEQLSSSLNTGDYWCEQLDKATQTSPLDYYHHAVHSAERNIERHTKELVEEIKRIEGRNEWLLQLRESL